MSPHDVEHARGSQHQMPCGVFSISDSHIDMLRSGDDLQEDGFTIPDQRPIMWLYFLAQNPDVVLPLRSFRHILHDAILATSEIQSDGMTPLFIFPYTALLNAVINNRLLHAIDCLLPHLNLTSREFIYPITIPELEYGPVPVLEYIIKDAMAVCNPIEYLLHYLKSLVSQYRVLTTGDERDAFRDHILAQQFPNQIISLSSIYGSYVWDSRWVPADQWRTLVQVIQSITTEVFPAAYYHCNAASILDGSHQGQFRRDMNEFILGIYRCIIPCFLHHYRPITQQCEVCPVPLLTPLDMTSGGDINRFKYGIPLFNVNHLKEAVSNEIIQCTQQYINEPERFSVPPVLVLPSSPYHYHSQSQTKPHKSQIPTGVPTEPPITAVFTPHLQNILTDHKDNPFRVKERMQEKVESFFDHVERYDDIMGVTPLRFDIPIISPYLFRSATFLLDWMLRFPPLHDPTYQIIKPLFVPITPHMTTLAREWYMSDPGFSQPSRR